MINEFFKSGISIIYQYFHFKKAFSNNNLQKEIPVLAIEKSKLRLLLFSFCANANNDEQNTFSYSY